MKRHYTHHPLNFHFCHLFSYYHHKISSCSQPFHYGQLFSYFQHLHFRHRPLFSQDPYVQRNLSQDQHARGTSHRINRQEELLTGSICKRNFSQDQHAWGTSSLGSTSKRNFSQDQHAPGTSHRINMHQELLTGSTCKRTFWSAYGCFSLDVKLHCLMSRSPILLLSIFPFFNYCQLFSYYSILFTSVVNCLEPCIYAGLSLFQTMHDLTCKDLGRCLWLTWIRHANRTHSCPRHGSEHYTNRQFMLTRYQQCISGTKSRGKTQDSSKRTLHF